MKAKSLSRARLFATPWTAAYQAPPSMGFSRQEYWSEVSLPSPGEDSIHGHYQIVNTEIRLIIFFAVKDGEALNSQQKEECQRIYTKGNEEGIQTARYRKKVS